MHLHCRVAAAVFFSGFVLTAAKAGPSFSIGSDTKQPGQTATIEVIYDAGDDVAAADLAFDYDQSILTADLSQCGGPIGSVGHTVACNDNGDIIQMILIAPVVFPIPPAPSGSAGTIAFFIDNTATTPSSLSLPITQENYFDASGAAVEPDTPAGTRGGLIQVSAPQIAVLRSGIQIENGGVDDLGDMAVGTTSISYVVQNNGDLELTVLTPVEANLTNITNFSVTIAPSETVAPTDTTTFTIEFDVPTAGPFAFDLSVGNNDFDSNPYEFQVVGTGLGPEIDIQRPAGTDNSIPNGGTDNVGNRPIDRPTTLIYTIANLGNQNLSIDPAPAESSLNNVSNFFVIVGPTSPLPPGESTTFEISFDVVTNGAFSFGLSVGNTDNNENPYDITVTGNGSGGIPEINISRDGIGIADGDADGLGFVPPGSSTIVYTIENSGNVTLSVAPPTLDNSVNLSMLSLTDPPPDSIAPGAETSFAVTFEPAAVGAFSFDISVDNNDSDENPYNFSVSGSVPDVDLSAELPPPIILVDNDSDGRPNPSDTTRFEVLLRNNGDVAVGEIQFQFAAPVGTTVTQANRSITVPGMIEFDAQSISATFQDFDGGGAFVRDLVTFDLLVDNDIAANILTAQGIFSYGPESVLTDDPNIVGSENPTLVPIGLISRLLAEDPNGLFGDDAAITEGFMAVASPGANGGAGSVRIYRILSDGTRQLAREVPAPPGFAGKNFGTSVAMEGNTLVVGSEDELSNVSNSKGMGTKVAIYRLNPDGTENLIAQIAGNLGTSFGSTVAIDGDTVVVGAPDEDEGAVVDAGAVYTYSLANLMADDDTPQRRIIANAPQSQSRFGAAIACADDNIVIGAPGPKDDVFPGTAAIYDVIQDRLNDLDQPQESTGQFGAAVAIEGSTVVIGSPRAPGGGGVFRYDAAGVRLSNKITGSDTAAGDEFGRDVALDSGFLYVGAPNASVTGLGGEGNFGAVYQFLVGATGKGFAEPEKIGAFSESGTFQQQEAFGAAVAAKNGALIIGAPESQSLKGAAAFRRGFVVFKNGFEGQ